MEDQLRTHPEFQGLQKGTPGCLWWRWWGWGECGKGLERWEFTAPSLPTQAIGPSCPGHCPQPSIPFFPADWEALDQAPVPIHLQTPVPLAWHLACGLFSYKAARSGSKRGPGSGKTLSRPAMCQRQVSHVLPLVSVSSTAHRDDNNSVLTQPLRKLTGKTRMVSTKDKCSSSFKLQLSCPHVSESPLLAVFPPLPAVNAHCAPSTALYFSHRCDY